MRGTVFEIQHFALYDGPGIRTVVYLKGCPLHCAWCHNPEGKSFSPRLLFHREKCSCCGLCAGVCPADCHTFAGGEHVFRRERCVYCGKCAETCMNGALALSGRAAETGEIIREVARDKPFYGEEGGLTLSGGEPLASGEFAAELLEAAKSAEINTCVETCGCVPAETVNAAARHTDLFLYDIKETDPARLKKFTGGDAALISRNLERLSAGGSRIILRCPVVRGVNLRREFFLDVARLAERLPGVEAVELEPYHPLGLAKYRALGEDPPYADGKFLPPEELAPHARAMRELTGKPIRLGTGEPV